MKAVNVDDVLKILHKYGKYIFVTDEKRYSSMVDEIANLKALTQEPRWIPVSERLPEEYKEVIVTDVETSDTYQSRYIGNGYWECDNGLFRNRIIAWQPKPKPYKIESEGEE